jgi:hypothetical protein
MEPPDPQRRMKESNWKPSLADHSDEIVATDFFIVDAWSWLAKKTSCSLFAIHVATSRIHPGGMSQHPDGAFMRQVPRNDARAGVCWLKQVGAEYMVHDRDTKLCESWKHIPREIGVETVAIPADSPNMTAYAGRRVRS